MVLVGVLDAVCCGRLKRNSYGLSFDRDSTVIGSAGSGKLGCNGPVTGVSFPRAVAAVAFACFWIAGLGSPNWKVELGKMFGKLMDN